MKFYALILSAILLSFTACDVQSGMTRKALETPTPDGRPKATEQPIDPADVVTVDTAQSGPTLVVNRERGKEPLDCSKYNKVTVNGDGYAVEIKGVCKQLMINGDRNTITGGAYTEIIVNGDGNTVEYYKYANGKKPIVTENSGPNTIEKGVEPEKPDANVKK